MRRICEQGQLEADQDRRGDEADADERRVDPGDRSDRRADACDLRVLAVERIWIICEPSSLSLPFFSVRPRLERGLHGFQFGVDLLVGAKLVDLVFEAGDPQRFAATFGEVGAALEDARTWRMHPSVRLPCIISRALARVSALSKRAAIAFWRARASRSLAWSLAMSAS